MSDRMKETLQRIASALVALPIYFYAIITDSFKAVPMLVVSMIITTICLYEFYMISEKEKGEKPIIGAGIFMSLALNIVMYLFAYGKVQGVTGFTSSFDARMLMGLIVFFVAATLIYNLFKRPLKGSIYSLSVTVFGVIFIVFFFSHIILMKALKDGLFYILILNVAVMMNDVAAYFGGVLFGKHKTGFEVSPNKSWEGYFSGLLFSVIGMIIANQVYISFFQRDLFTLIEAALIGIVISILANIGDLIESAVKRDGAIKDSGSIIPGHGGMWDVFDALVFTMPVFYYYLVIKGVP